MPKRVRGRARRRGGEEGMAGGEGGREAERGFDVMCDDDKQQGPSLVLLLSSLP